MVLETGLFSQYRGVVRALIGDACLSQHNVG
jgi:hypothetical protein